MNLHFSPLAIAVLLGALPVGFGAAFAARRLSQTGQPPAVAMTIATLATAVWAFVVMPGAFLLCVSCALGWTLLVLAVVDALAFRLPDLRRATNRRITVL